MKPETAGEVLDAYLCFLWQQFQYDWSWMSNPWVFWLIIPELIYLLFFTVKWMVLLFPITIPITTWQWFYLHQSSTPKESGNFMNN
jgi:hypothetical protein